MNKAFKAKKPIQFRLRNKVILVEKKGSKTY